MLCCPCSTRRHEEARDPDVVLTPPPDVVRHHDQIQEALMRASLTVLDLVPIASHSERRRKPCSAQSTWPDRQRRTATAATGWPSTTSIQAWLAPHRL